MDEEDCEHPMRGRKSGGHYWKCQICGKTFKPQSTQLTLAEVSRDED